MTISRAQQFLLGVLLLGKRREWRCCSDPARFISPKLTMSLELMGGDPLYLVRFHCTPEFLN